MPPQLALSLNWNRKCFCRVGSPRATHTVSGNNSSNYGRECGFCHESDSVLGVAIKGDASALDQLFAHCMPQLQRTGARLLGNQQDSEDAVQDALLSVFRHLHQFQRRAQFSTWLHRFVVNAAKSKLRTQALRPLTSSLNGLLPSRGDLHVEDILADPRPHPDEECIHRERS
jgi:DNA-directed RNA polymerase specialized sigma24 family protein